MENELRSQIAELEEALKKSQADIERLSLDVAILTQELLRERKERMDER